jgi:hypothetical protein
VIICDPEGGGGGKSSMTQMQGCRSGSGLDPDSIGSANPDPDPGGQKLPIKVEHFFKSSCFEVLDGLF